MKKTSSSAHKTLTELNITPLLDLAFVLLVIFIITTTPVVNDLDVDLPRASKNQKDPPRKANYVGIDPTGAISLNNRLVSREEFLNSVIALRTVDPDLSIIIRGDSKTHYRHILTTMVTLQQANVTRVELATEAGPGKPPTP